jgi:hypothetical protein
MTFKESSATALVRARGLGIFCLNKTAGRGEMAIIRDDRHQLSIRISKPVFIDGAGRESVRYQDFAVYREIDPLNVEMEVAAAGNAVVDGYEIYAPGEFNRLDGDANDEFDFRWLVNIDGDEMHGKRLARSVAAESSARPPVSKLFISNAVFYAGAINQKLFFDRVADGSSRAPFGNVAEAVAAKIEADAVRFSIRIGGEKHEHILPRVPGCPYKITIDNMDPDEDSPLSDMPDYYKFLADESGRQFDLVPAQDSVSSGQSVGKLSSCHSIVCDAESIEKVV